jgi:hypothetical protein
MLIMDMGPTHLDHYCSVEEADLHQIMPLIPLLMSREALKQKDPILWTDYKATK